MSPIKQILLLVGSPKFERSTSYQLLRYLEKHLNAKGVETRMEFVLRGLHDETLLDGLLSAIDQSDAVVLASPLYVDSLPAPVLRLMTAIVNHRTVQSPQPLFAAIMNCGFPEHNHNRFAISICRNFAEEAYLQWIGALSVGGGGAINGEPLEEIGNRSRFVRPALELMADALARGDPVPERAMELAAKLVIPIRLYVMMAKRNWNAQAKANGVQKQLDARPYLE